MLASTKLFKPRERLIQDHNDRLIVNDLSDRFVANEGLFERLHVFVLGIVVSLQRK